MGIHSGGMKRLRRQYEKRNVHKAVCGNSTQENNKCINMKNRAKKVVSKAMRKTSAEAFTEFKNCQNGMLRLLSGL